MTELEDPRSMSELCPIFLLDGGLGTLLSTHFSHKFDINTPLWSTQLLLSSPETLFQAHLQWACAGADVILTATYQASYEGFESVGVEAEEAEETMRWGVELVKKALAESERGGRVGLSLGAYGAVMVPSQEYSGKYDAEHSSKEHLRDWHLKRIEIFSGKEECWENVGLVAFETLPLKEEISAVREAMSRISNASEKDFWISCVFPGEQNVLPDGSSVKEVVYAMLGKREGARKPMGVGVNCTKVGKVEGLIEEFESAIEEFMKEGEVDEWPSLVVYPDGTKGEVYNTTTKEWENTQEESKDSICWDEILMDIVDRARSRGRWKSIFVGGCCKTSPDDIEKLRKRIDGRSSSENVL